MDLHGDIHCASCEAAQCEHDIAPGNFFPAFCTCPIVFITQSTCPPSGLKIDVIRKFQAAPDPARIPLYSCRPVLVRDPRPDVCASYDRWQL